LPHSFRFFEYVLFMPSGLRKRAVDQLKLRREIEFLMWDVGQEGIFPFCEMPSELKDAFMVSIYPKPCCAGHGNCANAAQK
jgi:hypothetical protein